MKKKVKELSNYFLTCENYKNFLFRTTIKGKGGGCK